MFAVIQDAEQQGLKVKQWTINLSSWLKYTADKIEQIMLKCQGDDQDPLSESENNDGKYSKRNRNQFVDYQESEDSDKFPSQFYPIQRLKGQQRQTNYNIKRITQTRKKISNFRQYIKCPQCPRVFSSKDNIESHMRGFHKNLLFKYEEKKKQIQKFTFRKRFIENKKAECKIEEGQESKM